MLIIEPSNSKSRRRAVRGQPPSYRGLIDIPIFILYTYYSSKSSFVGFRKVPRK